MIKFDFLDSNIRYIVTANHPILKRLDFYNRTAIEVLDILNNLYSSGYIVEIEADL